MSRTRRPSTNSGRPEPGRGTPFDVTQGSPEPSRGTVARLYDQFGASLYRYALMIFGRHDAAEDAVQQVFLALVRGPARGIQDPERYLRRAVRNACYSNSRCSGIGMSSTASAPTSRMVVEPR